MFASCACAGRHAPLVFLTLQSNVTLLHLSSTQSRKAVIKVGVVRIAFVSCFKATLFLSTRHNNDKTFLVWINEEDHTRVISMEKGGNMKRVFERFCRGLKEVGTGVCFSCLVAIGLLSELFTVVHTELAFPGATN